MRALKTCMTLTWLVLPLALFGCSSSDGAAGDGASGPGSGTPGVVACAPCADNEYCSAGECVTADGCDSGGVSGLLTGFDPAGSAAFLRRSGGVDRIFFQATSTGTDPQIGPNEPPFSRLVVEFNHDLFSAGGSLPQTFNLADTGTKDCELCVRGNSFCNVDKCAWDFVVDEGEMEIFTAGLADDGTGTCGPGTGSGDTCETDADCPGDGAEACAAGICQSFCYLEGVIRGAKLRQVLIAQDGTVQDYPGGQGFTWCLGDYHFSAKVPPPKEAEGYCVPTGTGVTIGDNIANFTLSTCDGVGYDTEIQTEFCGGETKAIWVVATAPWCGACSSWVPKVADAYERYKDKGLEIAIVLGENAAKDAPTVGYCEEYGEKKAVSPDRMYMDNENGVSWAVIWDAMDNYAGGSVGLPWQAVLDGQTMEYMWSSMAGTGDVVSTVCELIGDGDAAEVADCKENLIQ